MILHHCIFFYPFNLTVQNNPVVIDLRYLYGSTLESNHNSRNLAVVGTWRAPLFD